jgi:hypothetical protein
VLAYLAVGLHHKDRGETGEVGCLHAALGFALLGAMSSTALSLLLPGVILTLARESDVQVARNEQDGECVEQTGHQHCVYQKVLSTIPE